MSSWHGGKGHVQRPQTKAERDAYERKWDEIFGKDQKIKQKQHTELNWVGDNESATISTEEISQSTKTQE